MAKAGFEDVVGLFVAQFETCDQDRFRFVFRAHDTNHFVQIEERDAQTFQQMQTAFDFFQPEFQTARDCVLPEIAAIRRGFA